MANEVLITLKLVQEGGKIKVVADETAKLAKETKKVDNAQKAGKKSAAGFHKAQKGVAHAGMNSTKAFSKMKGEMGGSSGLVGAYATLAANVFAATAAFNALRGAAQVQTLAESFGFLAGVSGRTSEVIAGNIQRITGNAISMEDALRTAAIGIQSGFSSTQLERLTAVAKNASIALGRNLGDSVDRLVRGVAKLEPEILDELGIIVRLNTATEAYANKMNKAVGDLSEFERNQAFLNATLEQGEMKYGAIGDAVDANPFDKLAGSFTNLTNKMLGFISGALEPLISLFAGSQLAMAGALTMFGSTIITQMLPGLTNLTEKQLENAKAARAQADAQVTAGEKIAKAQRKVVKAGGDVSSPAGFANLQKKLKKGKASAKDMQIGLDSLRRSEAIRDSKLKSYSGDELKRKTAELEEIRRLKREVEELIKVENNRGKSTNKGIIAGANANQADTMAAGMGNIMGGGAINGFKQAFKANKELRKELRETKNEVRKTAGRFRTMGITAKLAFKTASRGAKLFGAALINSIPGFGQLIFFAGIVLSVFKKFHGSTEAVTSALSNLNAVGDTYAKKQIAIDTVQKRVNESLEIARNRTEETKDAFEIAGLEAQLYANRIKFVAGVTGEFADTSAQLQSSLSQDGVGIFTIMMMRAAKVVERMKVAFIGFIQNIMSGIRSLLEWAAGTRLFGESAGEALKSLNDFEEGLKPANRNMEAFKTAQLNAFDGITDPAIKKKINDSFGEGGLAGALDKAQEAVRGGADFAKSTKEIIDNVSEIGKNAGAANAAIEGFESGFQGLSKLLNKGSQAAKKKNEFTVLQEQLEGFQKTAGELVKLHGPDEARKQLARMIPSGVNKQLRSLGISFEDLITQVGDSGNLSTFIKEMADAAELSERIKTLQSANKSAVAADKAATNSALERLEIEMGVESIKMRGTSALLGSQEMALAQTAFDMRMKNSTEEKSRLIEMAEETSKDEINKINARTDFLTEADLARKATLLKDQDEALILAKAKITEEANFTEDKLSMARQKAVDKAGTTGSTRDRLKSIGEAGIFGTEIKDEDGEGTGKYEKGIATAQQKIEKLKSAFSPMMEELTALGPEGAFMSSIASGALTVASSLETIGTAGASSADKLAAVGDIITTFGNISAASSKARIAGIDSEINAEKKRDGKSKGSLAKIKALEAKKEQMKRKAFETDKKTKLASAVMNTASAMMAAASPPNPPLPLSAPAVAMAAALGAMQIATIAKSKYAGGGTSAPSAGTPQSISVGKRNNKVDVSKSATSGELNFLRGGRGVGSNANNFIPGGAAGMRKGYANGGDILVGERGPEIVSPRPGGYEVTPNDKMGSGTTNANFTINAVDAAGVAEVLTAQRGNIIGMIREAAHEHGEEFIEAVNTGAYAGGDG